MSVRKIQVHPQLGCYHMFTTKVGIANEEFVVKQIF